MALEDQLIQWDGKSADFLSDLYAGTFALEPFLEEVFDLIPEPGFQTAATWLLKHHLDQGHSISDGQRSSLIREMKSLCDWESKLHALQCLPKLKLTRRQADQAIRFLRTCLDDDNKFVRAWAFGGFHALAAQHTCFQSESEERLAWAAENEAPSVKARIRQATGQKRKT